MASAAIPRAGGSAREADDAVGAEDPGAAWPDTGAASRGERAPTGYATPRLDMATECLTTAFDASGQPPPLLFAGLGLVFIVVGYLVLLSRPKSYLGWFLRRRASVIAAIILIALWTVSAVAFTIGDWWNVHFGTAHELEGEVEELQTNPADGHGSEQFVVDGVRFQYSDATTSAGFNQTSVDGGPIRAGLHVRIRFVELGSGPTITKLELACPPGSPSLD